VKSARNRLILLGFICQGLTWDDYFLPLANVLLWIACLTVLRGRLRLGVGMECLLMICGAAAALLLGGASGHNTQFFLGHGLTLMQAVRLTRALDRREKVFSILMACFQLGVGCSFLFDLRFAPVFLGMVILLPLTFSELEAEEFPVQAAVVAGGVGAGPVAVIFMIAVLFFVVFPRGYFGAAIQPFRGGSAEPASPLDTVVDPTRSGLAQSRRALLQIQGENLGYLRCHSLGEFDGTRWSEPPSHQIRPVEPGGPEAERRSLYRRVNVKQVSSLRRILPADGRVTRVSGRFFQGAARNDQDAIECENMRNTASNIYEYWTDPRPGPEPLPAEERRRLSAVPPQSGRLRAWLETVVAGETNPERIARKIEGFLSRNFKYTLGAPPLSRFDPIGDFVLKQKEGHCERFAATLALLLRMENIPSRVVTGYLPRQRGGLNGWHTVRFSDAHAWTEAYLEGKGWVTLDATPAAGRFESGISWRDWSDALDLAWNLNIVNFSGVSQRYLLSGSLLWAARFASLARKNVLVPAGLAGLALLAVFGREYWTNRLRRPGSGGMWSPEQVQASHYYGRMLRAAARQGFHRAEQQTPLEFLGRIGAASPSWLAEARIITAAFCESRYGNQILTAARQSEIEGALQTIRQAEKNARPGVS
jgi:hypothetical protein